MPARQRPRRARGRASPRVPEGLAEPYGSSAVDGLDFLDGDVLGGAEGAVGQVAAVAAAAGPVDLPGDGGLERVSAVAGGAQVCHAARWGLVRLALGVRLTDPAVVELAD